MDTKLYCKNCGAECNQGKKFCPNCGTEIVKLGSNSQNRYVNEQQKEAKMPQLSLKQRVMFIGAFVSAIIAFAVGMVFWGVALAICGVLLAPPLLRKYSTIGRVAIFVVTIFIAYLAADEFSAMEEGTIEYVKQYHDPSSSYSIEEFMDIFDCPVEWEYEEKSGTEYITASFDDGNEYVEVVFRIGEAPNDYPILHKVCVDGVSNKELYEKFNFILFGE